MCESLAVMSYKELQYKEVSDVKESWALQRCNKAFELDVEEYLPLSGIFSVSQFCI